MMQRVSRRTFLKVGGATAAVVASGALIGSMLTDDEDPDPVDPFNPFDPADPQAHVTPTIGPRVDEEVEGYLAVAPRVLRSGQLETVSLALFAGQRIANSTVSVDLIKDDATVASGSAWVAGRGTVPLQLPDVAAEAVDAAGAQLGVESLAGDVRDLQVVLSRDHHGEATRTGPWGERGCVLR